MEQVLGALGVGAFGVLLFEAIEWFLVRKEVPQFSVKSITMSSTRDLRYNKAYFHANSSTCKS